MNKAQSTILHGRKSEYSSLLDEIQSFCSSSLADPMFRIIGISGYGGVGKSYLLASVLNEVKPKLGDSVMIRVDGSNQRLLSDFAGLISQQLAPPSLPSPAKSKKDYFLQTRGMIRALYSLQEGVQKDLEKDKDLAENVKKVANALYKIRPFLSKIPKAGPTINTLLAVLEGIKAEEYSDQAIKALQAVRSLKKSRVFFGLSSRKDILRDDPFNALADAYTTDAVAFVKRYQIKDTLKPTSDKIRGINRIILIVDDFETTGKVLGDFLLECLLGRLKGRLPLLVIFLGRDDLLDAHTGFNQHFGRDIGLRIRLEPFNTADGTKYLRDSGYSRTEATDIYEKARGYPFLLSLFAEHRSNQGERSVVFHKRFYERTTHWMTEQEKLWLLNVCYLDVVDEGTIEAMMPEVSAHVVMGWFANEASVRDVAGDVFAVQPFIRKMLLEYHAKVVGAKKREAFVDRAREAMKLIGGK